jgi:molybdopterin synthase catalytic subunit
MEVSVRLSPNLARQAGNARLRATLPEPATISDLIATLSAEYPDLGAQLKSAIPVLSGTPAAPNEPLQNGQEIALLTPISGGSGLTRIICGSDLD